MNDNSKNERINFFEKLKKKKMGRSRTMNEIGKKPNVPISIYHDS